MKRYWLFVYPQYDPQGGMHDFIESFSTIEAARGRAIEVLKLHYYMQGYYWHVYDSIENKIAIYATDNTRSSIPVEVMDIPLNRINDLDLYE